MPKSCGTVNLKQDMVTKHHLTTSGLNPNSYAKRCKLESSALNTSHRMTVGKFLSTRLQDPCLFNIRACGQQAQQLGQLPYTLIVNSCFAEFKRTFLSQAVQGTVAHIGYECR